MDNDTRRIDRARLGPVAGIDTGTRGTTYYDSFVSRRASYIGAATGGVTQGSKVLAQIVAKPPERPLEAPLAQSGGSGVITTTITYTYDPLYRLTSATYSNGQFFDYTYDSTGNRLSQTTATGTLTYTYDIANRLTDVGVIAYQWDANGNLLNDGTSTYQYDAANRLTQITQGANTYSFAYNGLGDRVSQTANSVTTSYTLDLNAGLTQVLSDGSNTYLYGLTRIGEQQTGGWQYHLTDALGSVRQLADDNGAVTLGKSYQPYGSALSSSGAGVSSYGFAGEWGDMSGFYHLRARAYNPMIGRFFTQDNWSGNELRPQSLNQFSYSLNNPVLYTDPTGNIPCSMLPPDDREEVCPAEEFYPQYGITFTSDRGIAWLPSDKSSVISGVKQVALAFGQVAAYLGRPMPSSEVFRRVLGPTNFYFTSKTASYYCERLDSASGLASGTMCYENARGKLSPQLIAHELGHVFNAVITNKINRGELPANTITPYNALYNEGIYVWVGSQRVQVAGVGACTEWKDKDNDGVVGEEGECVNYYTRTGLGYAPGTQYDTIPTQNEDFADMFVNWAYNSFEYSSQLQAPYAYARYNWMNSHMREWIRVSLGIPQRPAPPPPVLGDRC